MNSHTKQIAARFWDHTQTNLVSKSTPSPTRGGLWSRGFGLKELQLGAAGVVGGCENGMGLLYQLHYASQIDTDNCIAP